MLVLISAEPVASFEDAYIPPSATVASVRLSNVALTGMNLTSDMHPRATRSGGNSLWVSDALLCVSLTMKTSGYPADLQNQTLWRHDAAHYSRKKLTRVAFSDPPFCCSCTVKTTTGISKANALFASNLHPYGATLHSDRAKCTHAWRQPIRARCGDLSRANRIHSILDMFAEEVVELVRHLLPRQDVGEVLHKHHARLRLELELD
jgi:hypothetical protein